MLTERMGEALIRVTDSGCLALEVCMIVKRPDMPKPGVVCTPDQLKVEDFLVNTVCTAQAKPRELGKWYNYLLTTMERELRIEGQHPDCYNRGKLCPSVTVAKQF